MGITMICYASRCRNCRLPDSQTLPADNTLHNEGALVPQCALLSTNIVYVVLSIAFCDPYSAIRPRYVL
jgi:hypothetical protein